MLETRQRGKSNLKASFVTLCNNIGKPFLQKKQLIIKKSNMPRSHRIMRSDLKRFLALELGFDECENSGEFSIFSYEVLIGKLSRRKEIDSRHELSYAK